MTSFRKFYPNDLNRLSKCNFDPLTETFELAFYMQYYATWPALFQVCEDMDGNIIGYIMGKLESSPKGYEGLEHYLPWHAHITALTVAPEARRLGIGRILTEKLEEAANKDKALFVDLFVRRSNQRAIDFYRSMGYSVFRVVKNYYPDQTTNSDVGGEDAFDMRKSMQLDKKHEHVREDGEKFEVRPEDVW